MVAGLGLTGRIPVSGPSIRLMRLAALALAREARASAMFCSARSTSFVRWLASASRLA